MQLVEIHPNRRRQAHWLRLTGHVDAPARCDHPKCTAEAQHAAIDRVVDRVPHALTVVCCTDHQRWASDELEQQAGGLSAELFRVGWCSAIREDGHWWRMIDYRDAVAAAGAARCERCPDQALYLTAGVDGGVPDKWWPAVLCAAHAQEHATSNGATLDEGGPNFGLVAAWDGASWGLPLPWPLTTPAPDDLALWVRDARLRRELGLATEGPTSTDG